jgi:hypothetical protein
MVADEAQPGLKNLPSAWIGHVAVNAQDNCRFVVAVRYRYRAGIPSHDLPERFGDWKYTHRRFSLLGQGRVLQNMLVHPAADADKECAIIDSTILRRRCIATRYDKIASTCLALTTSPPPQCGSIDETPLGNAPRLLPTGRSNRVSSYTSYSHRQAASSPYRRPASTRRTASGSQTGTELAGLSRGM